MQFQRIFVFIFFSFVFVKGGRGVDNLHMKILLKKTNEKKTTRKHTVTTNYDDDNIYNNDYDNNVEDEMSEDDTVNGEANLGYHYFQGDILSTKKQMAKIEKLIFHDSGKHVMTRGLIKDVDRTWKNAVVPYTIKKNMDDAGKQIIKGAISHWETNTCLRFTPRTTESDYVEFSRGIGCASYVGRIGGKQTILIGNNVQRCCVGNIIHEIGHTIGFFHEQSRPDRDSFVKIKYDNIKSGYRNNFERFSKNVIDSKEVAYDYGSIMHYPRKIFNRKSDKPTVIPLQNDAAIGQRNALSAKDLLQAKKLYGCST